MQLAVDTTSGVAFTFYAQKSSQLPLIAAPSDDLKASFFTFKYGEESRLQQHLYELDTSYPLTVWLLASEGMEGDAAAGIVPTLAREFPYWKICTAIFPSTLSEETDRIQAVSRLSDYLVDDQIVRFESNGHASVAKIVPLLPLPSKPTAFDPNGLWVSDGTAIKQKTSQKPENHELTIEVVAWSEAHSSWRGFIGTVTESRAAGIIAGQYFVGVTESIQLSNRINCQAGMLAPIDELDVFLAEYALAMVISASALGTTRLEESDTDIPNLRVLFPEVTKINKLTGELLKSPTLSTHVSFELPSEGEKFSLIVTDSSTATTHPELLSWLDRESGEIFVWDTILRQKSRKDPWSIRRALKAGLKLRDSTVKSSHAVIQPLELVKTLPLFVWNTVLHWMGKMDPRGIGRAGVKLHDYTVNSNNAVIRPQELVKALPMSVPELSLFSADKFYIILGGASDLGAHMSMWLYQVSLFQ